MCILAAQSLSHFNSGLYERLCLSVHPLVCWSVFLSEWKSGKTSGLDACVWGLGLGCGWGLDASLSNRETHVESGTNQKDARRKKKAINQTKHNHKKFKNIALKTFFLRQEPPLLVQYCIGKIKNFGTCIGETQYTIHGPAGRGNGSAGQK